VFSGWGRTETFYLHDEVLLTESDIVKASVVTLQKYPAVEVIFSEAGREKFAQITAQNINKHLGVLVNGELVCVPLIRDTVSIGKAIINGDFSEEEARRIANKLVQR
jgi:preprotein translocase subunit SecD